MKTNDNVRAQSNTPQQNSSISNKLDLKLKASMSKNNSPVSHSERSQFKFASGGNGQQRENLNKSEVKKDKLFTEEDPYANSKEYQIGDEVNNSKNDWSYNASKPGVDRAEFYNPNDEDPHSQSIQNPNNVNAIMKGLSGTKNIGDRFQGEIDNRETGYGDTQHFQSRPPDQDIKEIEDMKQAEVEFPQSYSAKKLVPYNNNSNFQTSQARVYREPAYEEAEDSNEDIGHDQ